LLGLLLWRARLSTGRVGVVGATESSAVNAPFAREGVALPSEQEIATLDGRVKVVRDLFEALAGRMRDYASSVEAGDETLAVPAAAEIRRLWSALNEMKQSADDIVDLADTLLSLLPTPQEIRGATRAADGSASG
jgi:hypothetical protein